MVLSIYTPPPWLSGISVASEHTQPSPLRSRPDLRQVPRCGSMPREGAVRGSLSLNTPLPLEDTGMSEDYSPPSLSRRKPLWHYQGRNRAMTIAVLDGVPPKTVASRYSLPAKHMMPIVRQVCERACPWWVDEGGMPCAWQLTLTELRQERWRFRR